MCERESKVSRGVCVCVCVCERVQGEQGGVCARVCVQEEGVTGIGGQGLEDRAMTDRFIVQ